MAPQPVDGRPDVGAGPAEIRTHMGETRDALAESLAALKQRLFSVPAPRSRGATTVAKTSKSRERERPSADDGAKRAKKSSGAAKSKSAGSKSAAGRSTASAAKKTGGSRTKAGAVAAKRTTVKASAAKGGSSKGKASKGGSSKARKTTRRRPTVTSKAVEVLGDVLAGAAAGAVVGAAQAAVEDLAPHGELGGPAPSGVGS